MISPCLFSGCNENFGLRILPDSDFPAWQKSGPERMRTHIAACQNKRNFICDVCGRAFNTVMDLKKLEISYLMSIERNNVQIYSAIYS